MRSASPSRSSRGREPTWLSVALDIRVAERGQAFAGRLAGRDGGEALLDVAAVLLEVQRRRSPRGQLAGSASRSPRAIEVVGQAPGLVAGPGLEGGHELALVDQAVLQCEQSEEEIAIGGDGGIGNLRSARPRSDIGRRQRRRQGASHRSHYRTTSRGIHSRPAGSDRPGRDCASTELAEARRDYLQASSQWDRDGIAK